eukprot:15232849-Alexandrium_andersonii.AAC.1
MKVPCRTRRCQALYLAALASRPDLDCESALAEMLGRVTAAAPEDPLPSCFCPDAPSVCMCSFTGSRAAIQ